MSKIRSNIPWYVKYVKCIQPGPYRFQGKVLERKLDNLTLGKVYKIRKVVQKCPVVKLDDGRIQRRSMDNFVYYFPIVEKIKSFFKT
jgi:hypothetical protein